METGWIGGSFPQPVRPGAAHRQTRYALYLPSGLPARRRMPLLVMLHGCHQDALSFAAGTRMNLIAERHRFIVLYPEQSRLANALGCWNWFDRDSHRPGGEATRIAALVRSVRRRYPVDRSRVYLAGMSAGGAMAAILAMTNASLFAACAIASGVMYRAADSAGGAMRAMREGSRHSPEAAAQQALAAWPRPARFVPALIMHGGRDPVVNPLNARQLIAQFARWAEVTGEPGRALAQGPLRPLAMGGFSYAQRDYLRGGQPVLREILIENLGHAWSGGDPQYPFNDPAGPDASRLVWDFVSRFRRPARARWPATRFWARWR
jgi:poly(hydroxyalkanoate) depolymerase family esterase